MTTARVLIIDDHVLFAEAIRLTLEANGITVVGIVNTVEEALPAVRRLRPDLALVDIGLPDGSGLTLGQRILQESETQVVVLSALEDPRAVREALQVGFHGYIIKNTPISRFVEAVEAVLSGEVVVPRMLAPRVAGMRSSEEEAVALLVGQLTPRELEVLELLVEGANGQSIARSLGISPNTVRTHVQNVLTKLQVNSRLEAATFAVRHGIVGSPYREERRLASGG
jgi:two-component system nitrate/nitrite response regulator NarL